MYKSEYKLNNLRITGISVAETGIFALEVMIRLYLLNFYTDVVGLKAELAGLAISAGIFWDAISDPLMGILSDKTQSSLGKRRPYILAGSIGLALATFIIFNPPFLESNSAKFSYLLLSFIFLSTCLTVLSIPHTALVADIAVDPDKRNKIFAIKMILGNMGLLLAISLPLLLSQEKQGLSDFYSLSFILAITIITSGLFSFFSSKGFDTNTHKNPSNQLISLLLKQVIANRAFLLFILAYFIAYIGVAINSSLALYYYQYKLGLRNQEIGLILIIFILSWLLASLLWLSLSNRFHKQKLAFLGIFLLGVLTSISYPFFPEKQLFYPLFMAVIGGFLVGSIFLFDSILADLEEADRLKTGTEKDGIYFSLAKFSMKASRSFAVALSGFLLSLIHFLPKQAQNPETNFQLGLLFGPFVGFFFILSSILFLKIPLKKNGVI